MIAAEREAVAHVGATIKIVAEELTVPAEVDFDTLDVPTLVGRMDACAKFLAEAYADLAALPLEAEGAGE